MKLLRFLLLFRRGVCTVDFGFLDDLKRDANEYEGNAKPLHLAELMAEDEDGHEYREELARGRDKRETERPA